MKDNFKISENALELLSLDETLKARQPYMVIAISATGIDDDVYADHRPTRIYVKEYVYSEENNGYIEGIGFDKLVEATQESIQVAIDNLETVDVFERGGIDREAYLRGENVESLVSVQDDFNSFIAAHADNTKFIMSSAEFCMKMLHRIGCDEELLKQKENHNLLDITALASAYLADNKSVYNKGSNTLEELRNVINGRNDNSKILGVDARCEVMTAFATKRGREMGFIASDLEAQNAVIEKTYKKDMSDNGKLKYRDASLESKFDKLVKIDVLNEAMMNRDYDCALNRLYDCFENKNGIKGVILMQCATTGKGTSADVPIQFTALKMDIENGALKPTKDGCSFDIKCDNRSLQQAISIKESGGFDAFAYTGINLDTYRSGKITLPNGKPSNKPLKTDEQALATISAFFSKVDINEYPIVSCGSSVKAKTRSYAQEALSSLGNIPMIDAPFIDFADVLKQYAYVSHYDAKYERNAIFDEEKWSSNTFSLEDLAKYKDKPIRHTQFKCMLMGGAIDDICRQHYEMEYGKSAPAETKHYIVPEEIKSDPMKAEPVKKEQHIAYHNLSSREHIGEQADKQSQIRNHLPTEPTREMRREAPPLKEDRHHGRPFSPYTREEATAKGETALQEWRVSQRENRVCAKSLLDGIIRDRNTSSPNGYNVIQSLKTIYPEERVNVILAIQVFPEKDMLDCKLNTGIFSSRTQEWAKNIIKSYPSFEYDNLKSCDISGKIDAKIINTVIEEYLDNSRGINRTVIDKPLDNEASFIDEGYTNMTGESVENAERSFLMREAADIIKENAKGAVASAPKNSVPTQPLNSDIMALITAMNAQTAAIREQNDLIRSQNDMVIKTFAAQAKAFAATISTTIEVIVDKEVGLSKDTVDKLIDVKEQIKEYAENGITK